MHTHAYVHAHTTHTHTHTCREVHSTLAHATAIASRPTHSPPSQLPTTRYFEDAPADAVAQLSPYNTTGTTRTRLHSDSIYSSSGGGIVAVSLVSAAAGYSGGLYGYATLGIETAADGGPVVNFAAGTASLSLPLLGMAAASTLAALVAAPGGR
jgi:hypothetical protein